MECVELHSAFCWTCDSCGRQNFTAGIEGQLDESVFEALDAVEQENRVSTHVEGIGSIDEDGGDCAPFLITKAVLAPATVKCECGAEFQSHIVSEIDDYEI